MRQHENVMKLLDEKQLDAILISNCYNIRYLSGFSGGEGYLYISHEKQIIITDFRYTIQAEQESQGFEVIELQSTYPSLINDIMKTDSVKRLGFEAMDLLYSDYKDFEKHLSVEGLIPLEQEISDLRSIKTDEELLLIRKAEEIGDLAFEKILGIIKPGMKEIEIAAQLEYLMKMNGAEALSFDTIVASGIHSSMPHAAATEKGVQSGDFITMDFGCRYKGYCSDMTRTIVLGKATSEQKKIYQTVLDAQMAALDFIKAGYTGREIDLVARQLIDQAGYEGCFGHGLGHSVGLFIHESPRLSPKEEHIIHHNTIETVEPGIYIKNFGGVRIEDLVVVTEDGHINFTGSEKKLIEL